MKAGVPVFWALTAAWQHIQDRHSSQSKVVTVVVVSADGRVKDRTVVREEGRDWW